MEPEPELRKKDCIMIFQHPKGTGEALCPVMFNNLSLRWFNLREPLVPKPVENVFFFFFGTRKKGLNEFDVRLIS